MGSIKSDYLIIVKVITSIKIKIVFVYCCAEFRCVSIMPKRTDINNDLRGATAAAHRSEKANNISSELSGAHYSTEENIIRSGKTFKKAGHLPRSGCPSKFSPMSEPVMSRESVKTTSYTLLLFS